MMRKYSSAVVAFALLGTPVPVQATDPALILAPSSPWVVNYADDSCRLIRIFGQGEQQVRLEFRMFAPERYFWLLVSGKPVRPASMGSVQIVSRFEPDDRDTPHTALSGKLDETTPAIMFMASFATRDAQEALSNVYKKDREAYQRDVRGSTLHAKRKSTVSKSKSTVEREQP